MTNSRKKEILSLVIEKILAKKDDYFICNVITNYVTLPYFERQKFLEWFKNGLKDIPQEFKESEGWRNPEWEGAAWWKSEEQNERIKYLEYLKSKL